MKPKSKRKKKYTAREVMKDEVEIDFEHYKDAQENIKGKETNLYRFL